MKWLLVAIALAASQLWIDGLAAFAQEREGVLLTRGEARAYHACLFAAWVEDYCRENSWKPTANWDRVYLTCVAANGGGRFPLAGRNWRNTDDYCAAAARGLAQ
jgi:hypothetical protein